MSATAADAVTSGAGAWAPTDVATGSTESAAGGGAATPLVEEAARWPAGRLRAIVVPENGTELARAAGIAVLSKADDLTEATAAAVEAAGSDGVVLFSPGAPTPADVGNWEDRSTQFREALEAAARA